MSLNSLGRLAIKVFTSYLSVIVEMVVSRARHDLLIHANVPLQ